MKKYICPMGCVEPKDEPGNCPVCRMPLIELQNVRDDSRTSSHKFALKENVRVSSHEGSRLFASEKDVRISSRSDSHKFASNNKHHEHRVEDFLKKFWLSLILTIFVIVFSLDLTKLLPVLSEQSVFSPLKSVLLLIFSSIVFFYGGLVFLISGYKEIKAKNPGMMTLISLAITSAYVYSILTIFFKIGQSFWWELTSLIAIMLLGHYFEMKSVSSAQRALQEIEKLLPDQAEVLIQTNADYTRTNANKNITRIDANYTRTDANNITRQTGVNENDVQTYNNHQEPKSDSHTFALKENVRVSSREGSHTFATKIVPLNELKIGDIVIVRPGGKIPADGIVIEGSSEVNESMITGESKPVFKKINSEVIAGTINGDGVLKIKVTKIGEQTFLAGIKRLILEAQKSKSKLQVLADVFAKYLTFIAIGVSVLSFVIWLLLQKDIAFALERAVTVLVIACPHALGLAVPLVVAISTSLAVHNGFLIRNRLQLELARKVNLVLFDKTGTLTTGKFSVKQIIKFSDLSEKEILQISASLNQYSQHFIAQGILEKAKEENVEILKVENFENLPGRGVKGKINDKVYFLGGENLLKEFNLIPPKIETIGTISYLITDLNGLNTDRIDNERSKSILGVIILEDEIRKEAREAIDELHKMGISVVMVTGDKKEVAEKVAQELGIDEYFAEVLPQEKVEIVKRAKSQNSISVNPFKNPHSSVVMFVGDGINDAPALMQADVGVAIGAGTNVALESAGIILVRNDPRDIVKLIKLSKITYRKMIENLFWAAGYNIVMIPLAAGFGELFKIMFSLPGSEFTLLPGPAIAAIFMSLSTIIVSLNALRMRGI